MTCAVQTLLFKGQLYTKEKKRDGWCKVLEWVTGERTQSRRDEIWALYDNKRDADHMKAQGRWVYFTLER